MDLKVIDQKLVESSVVRYNYAVLNPYNRQSEFEKFEKDPTYNPQLKYNTFDAQVHIEELENLDIPQDTALGEIFCEVRDKLLVEAKALQQIGSDNFSTTEVFGSVEESLVEKAKEILSQEKIDEEDEEEETITDHELADRMKQQLEIYNSKGWLIKFNENASSRVSVNGGNKIITIKKGEMFTEQDVRKLIVHEIGTHALRAHNGRAQEYKMFSVGLPDYLATEEGLAGYNERSQGIKNPATIRYYALSTLITYLAQTKGFVDIYNEVRKYYDSNWDCFKAIVRVKRGLGDTSKPGGYLKDHAYLKGMFLIEDYVINGGDIKLLYAGKIGVQHVHLVENGIIKPADKLPEFLE